MSNWTWGAPPKGDIGFGLFGNVCNSPSPPDVDKDLDINKQVDNLFAGRLNEADEWLRTLRNAAAAGVTQTPAARDIRRFERARPFLTNGSFFSSKSNNNSGTSGGTSLPLLSQLDFTMLKEYEIVQRAEEYSQQFAIERRKMLARGFGSPQGQSTFERSVRTPADEGWASSDWTMYYPAEDTDDSESAVRDDSGRPRSDRRSRRICRFCYKNGERPEWYTTHTLHERSSNIVSCPVLRNYECKQCGATGDHAHTDSYCPFRFGSKDWRVMACLEATEFTSNGMPRRPRSREAPSPSWHQEDFPPLRDSPLL